MSTANLDKLFDPHHVAVIGASDDPASAGCMVLRNLVGSGFRGVVYPVNAERESVLGIHAYRDVAGLPAVPDLAVIATPAATVPALVRACGQRGTRAIVVTTPGFREAGPPGRELEDEIRREQRQFAGLRILGPNCLGLIVPRLHLNASFSAAMPAPGRIGFISQSGALCTAVLDWAIDEGIGFSYFASLGNMLDVSMADLIDYFGSATETSSIILYIESISEAREFISAARAFARTKPIVAYKAGRFAASARAAASHTGAMAGVDAVYQAAFQRAGIERIFDIDDMFDCAELLARRNIPRGDRLAIVTNAGGPGVMTTDALIAHSGQLAKLSQETLAELDGFLPEGWSHANPIDILDDAPPERFARVLESVLLDPAVDAVLVILTPQAMTDPTTTARAVGQAAARAHKPVLAAWMGSRMVGEGIQLLGTLGIPTYPTPVKAVRAFMHLVSYARNLETLQETPRQAPLEFNLDRPRLRSMLAALRSGPSDVLSEHPQIPKSPNPQIPLPIGVCDVLSEHASKALLEAYGIPVTKPLPAHSAEEAVEVARRLGYPVVLKIDSPQITHKTEVGGVVLGLPHDQAVREAFAAITHRAAQLRPEARILGVTVQPMVAYPNSFELILGTKKDPVFGPVIMVGMGGVAAEVFQDRALGLPPLGETLARRMLESLKSWPLLSGYRGRPGANLDRLIEIIMRFSYLVADAPEIQEFDVNPLLVTPQQAIALDARMVIDRSIKAEGLRPYAHLAIRPYPEEYVTRRRLKDGTPLVLRPIKPEDEPLWHELLASCSTESIRFRFNYLFKQTTHEMAARYCFIDYDRELGIVAELEEQGRRKLIGVGRLVADADHHVAEYAVLVADRWQGRGLGSLLTEYCLKIAKPWGVQRVVAEFSRQNARMLATFRNHAFTINDRQERDVVLVSKEIGGKGEGLGIRD
ncbi:MAG: bifunctional acetate--CoA ligase family protein/GNAT family N-acetyltransferase [Thermoguttaceae bacterium]